MQSLEALLVVCERFAAAREISEARASTIIFNDGKRLKRIRSGADMGVRAVTRTLEKLSAIWPEDADWPEVVRRPPSRRHNVQTVERLAP